MGALRPFSSSRSSPAKRPGFPGSAPGQRLAWRNIGPIRMRAADAAANRRADEIARANAKAARDPDQVLAILTRNNATFSERDLERHLAKHIGDVVERESVKGRVLGHN